jgi:hypothetical protein
MKGQANPIIAGVIGIVTGLVGLIIVGTMLNTDGHGTISFGSGVLNTIMANVPILMAVSLLALAGGFLFMRQ